ncbi:uncharacterized protein Nmag_1616 [Natrialba magadii ATCC 43099]|uniref:DUF4935 domain-containing protein n=1 Tax=Natrialba magadii (strain ATCC 43099 / DSM 3394 / CCM 3739 / CIP 104546 / IAM 13178 / JCM 8861 / NBRC 102185 / NCIMB 2190 / MS3) TaxID=547559 RepID=D3SUD4_NATMM|nr:hypothetical protein [Natrialba magadii]ADD05192.1 uncharacterized protein Nmag_1616 [Natrialba magadii ATCC 43099]ELY23229.1 hypothetical protein C500_20606 [Natrialba magadii ATCC 43099]
MSSESYPGAGDDVFVDTSVLIDYTKETLNPSEKLRRREAAAEVLVSCLPQLTLSVSQKVAGEYTGVAERRQSGVKDATAHASTNPLSTFDFRTCEELNDRDADVLNSFLDELLDQYSDEEALRRLNKRQRAFRRAERKLFKEPSPRVSVHTDSYTLRVFTDLAVHMYNDHDRKILAHAVDWFADGFGNCFITSDEEDFKFDDSEDRIYTFEERVNKIAQAHCDCNGSLYIRNTENFISEYIRQIQLVETES